MPECYFRRNTLPDCFDFRMHFCLLNKISNKMLRKATFLLTITRNYQKTSVLSSRKTIGVHHRAKILKDDNKDYVEMLEEDPEFDADSDFFDMDISHKEHEREMKRHREKLPKWIVRDKYFKTTTPNFLTWAEKEQIRHLHQQDPDEWTPERLCQCFPIDMHHIGKLLKNRWTPNSAKRVEKHDAAAKENWEKFRRGELTEKLPPKFAKHLLNFKDREIDLSALPKFEPKPRLSDLVKTDNDEFLSIITSAKKLLEVEEPKKEEIKQIESNEKPSSYDKMMKELPKEMRNEKMTLDELKMLLGDQDDPVEVDEPIEATEKKEIQVRQNPAGTGIVQKSQKIASKSIDFPKKYEVGVLSQKNLNSMYIEPIQERIKIPKKLWKKNATYKYKDCFYDDDGELLYRVPGLTK
ncbi:uncharacterized protein LOC134837854 [Culicoides brevitarsis]|uniref:uncharacterized protein LOC134837854 n=1 Tax=Culicoides brevitarsis TaxID=469753 RepID=UPI00307CC11F